MSDVVFNPEIQSVSVISKSGVGAGSRKTHSTFITLSPDNPFNSTNSSKLDLNKTFSIKKSKNVSFHSSKNHNVYIN